VDHEDRALVRREAPEAAVELVAGGHPGAVTPVARGIERLDPDLDRLPAPVPPRLHVAGADEDAIQPRVEAIWIPNGPDVEPCTQERLLDGVARTLLVAEDQARRPLQARDRGGRERREGVVVAGLRASDELVLHGLRDPLGDGPAAVLSIMGDRPAKSFRLRRSPLVRRCAITARRRCAATMRSADRSQTILAAGAALVGLLAVWVAYGPGRLPDAIPHAAAGFVAIGCGLAGGIRVRWSRIGPLLCLLGLAWFAADFSTCLNIEPLAHRCLEPRPLGDAAGALAWAWLGVFGHIAASFPDGRLRSPGRRAAVVVAYLAVIAVSLAGLVPPPAQLLGARTAMAVAVALGSLAVLAALLAADARRASLTPDRAVGLGQALASALGDPRFRIAFTDPHHDGWVDATGRPARRPAPANELVVTPILRGTETLAAIEHDPATLADPQIRASVAMAVELAAHNSRLRAELETQLVEVAASRRRLVNAALDERRELAAQVDSDVQVPLQALASRLADIDGGGAAPDEPGDVRRAAQQLDVARDEIRDLASGLFPRALTTDGLATALQDLARRSTVPVDVEVPGDISAGPEVDATIYFVCAETLANAARHASASRIRLRVARNGETVTAVVEDDGVGGADLGAGTGLRGLRDRVEALDGTLDIASAPGMGTRLTVTIPVSRGARQA